MSDPLHYCALDAHAVAALRSEYDVYVVSYESEVSNLFFAAMESAGATWFWRGMPEPYWGAIFLPRAELLTLNVSQVFQADGFEELGAHLEEIASRDTPEDIIKYMAPDDGQADATVEEQRSAPAY